MDRPVGNEFSSEYNPNSPNPPLLDSDELERQRLSKSMNLPLTIQELKILKECHHNATYQRGLPVAAVTVGTMYYFMKTGSMVKNRALLFGSSVVGFVLGTMSYRSVCMEKLLALPNSSLKERILQAQGKLPQVKVEVPGQDGGSWFESMMPSDPAPMGTSLDFDTHQSNGFDEVPRSQSDLDSHYAINPPLPPATSAFVTFDDLRRQNRDQYDRVQQQQPYNRSPMNQQGQAPPGQYRQNPNEYYDQSGGRAQQPPQYKPSSDGYYGSPSRPASDEFLR